MGILSEQYKQMLMNMKPSDITAEFINKYLADTSKKVNGKMIQNPSIIKTYDTFTLKANEYFNKSDITTNVGLFIYNKFLIEDRLINVLGYINDPITSNIQGSIEDKISEALLNDRIVPDDFVDYLNRLQWLSMQFNTVFSNSFTMKMIKPIPKVIELKKKLVKENKEQLDAGSVITGVNIEKELLSVAKEELKNDPAMSLYESGARGSFNNNYKAISVTKGPVRNPGTNKWEFVANNFMEGIDKKDIPAFGNSVVAGAFPKAVGTQESGYLSKQLTAAFQGLVLDDPGTDCGTTKYVELLVTENRKKDLLDRYIVDGGKLVKIDDTNFSKYLNKTIKLRSPMFCKSDKICNKCAGELYYKLGIKNIGLTTSKMATTMTNLKMKQFHDSTVSITKLDIKNLTF